MSVVTAFSCLPYAQATPTQRQQALDTARQVLGAAYPYLSPAQWAAALNQVQPQFLVPEGGPVVLAHEGLTTLVHYLASPGRAGAVACPTDPTGANLASPQLEPPTPASRPAGSATPSPPSQKQTYAIPLDLREQLARISYWRRVPINQLVVYALTRLVADYPDETTRPLPPPTPLA